MPFDVLELYLLLLFFLRGNNAEFVRIRPAFESSKATAVCITLTDLPKVQPILKVDLVMNAILLFTIVIDSGFAMLVTFMPSMRFLSVDPGTTAGNRIEFFWGVFTAILFLPPLVCYDSFSTGSEASGT